MTFPSAGERIEIRKGATSKGPGHLILSHRPDGLTLLIGAFVSKPRVA